MVEFNVPGAWTRTGAGASGPGARICGGEIVASAEDDGASVAAVERKVPGRARWGQAPIEQM